MGITLIVIGSALLIVGIVMVASKQADVEQPQAEPQPQPQVIVVEKEVHHTFTVQSDADVRVAHNLPEKKEPIEKVSEDEILSDDWAEAESVDIVPLRKVASKTEIK